MTSQLPVNDPLHDVVIHEDIELQQPSLYNVVLLNDDYTPMDFVIEVLMQLFGKDYGQAYQIMMQVHQCDRGIAGTYAREVADEKTVQVNLSAKANEFPLTAIMEQV